MNKSNQQYFMNIILSCVCVLAICVLIYMVAIIINNDNINKKTIEEINQKYKYSITVGDQYTKITTYCNEYIEKTNGIEFIDEIKHEKIFVTYSSKITIKEKLKDGR